MDVVITLIRQRDNTTVEGYAIVLNNEHTSSPRRLLRSYYSAYLSLSLT